MAEKLPVPSQNVEVFRYLFSIETGLREFILEVLRGLAGPTWYKSHLPGDVLTKYREGLRYERCAKWVQVVPHHPIYYTDFADLKKIIERGENWSGAFGPILGRKDLVVATLSELEVIRNKIAHNRKATDTDVAVVRSCFEKLAQAIGPERFRGFTERCTFAPDIPERLTALHEEGKRMFDRCSDCMPLPPLANSDSVKGEWWFDESYLGNSVEWTSKFFQCLEEYARLPRGRGAGYGIEAWVKSSDLVYLYSAAEEEFRALTTGPAGG